MRNNDSVVQRAWKTTNRDALLHSLPFERLFHSILSSCMWVDGHVVGEPDIKNLVEAFNAASKNEQTSVFL